MAKSRSQEASAPLDAPTACGSYDRRYPLWSRYYTYEQEPDLYDLNDQDQQTLKLYEERLVANKTAARQEK